MHKIKIYPYLIIMLPFMSFVNGNIEDLNNSQFLISLAFGFFLSVCVLLFSITIAISINSNSINYIPIFSALSLYIIFNYRFLNLNFDVFLFLIMTVPILISFILLKSGEFRKIFSFSIYAMFTVSAFQVAYNYLITNVSFNIQPSLDKTIEKTVFNRPNVYLLILDAYSRSDELSKIGIENDYFIENMTENGFFVAHESTSNFMQTHFSLQALYSMEYPDLIENNTSLRRNILLGENLVTKTFKSLGYKHVRMGPNLSTNADCSGREDYCLFKINNARGTAQGQGSIYDHLIMMTPYYEFFTILFSLGFLLEKPQNYYKATIDDAHREWEKVHKKIVPPVFLELNVWQPHAPYLFDDECNRTNNIFMYGKMPKKSEKHFEKAIAQYGDEIHCVNKQIMNFIEFINKNDPGAIVIILSDHGHKFSTNFDIERKNWTEEAVQARSSNLWAAKLPNRCNNLVYSDISVVNTFRVVFSCIYGEEPDFLPDKVFSKKIKGFQFYLHSER